MRTRVPYIRKISRPTDHLSKECCRVDKLQRRTDAEVARQKQLRAAALSTWQKVERAYENLSQTFESRRPSGGNFHGHCLILIAALTEAVKILEMEFSDAEGSGRKTLLKCRTALRKAEFMVTDGKRRTAGNVEQAATGRVLHSW